MSDSFKEIADRASDLSSEDRARLAETLLESLHSPLAEAESAWKQEVEARIAEFDRGDVAAHSAAEVFAEAQSTHPW